MVMFKHEVVRDVELRVQLALASPRSLFGQSSVVSTSSLAHGANIMYLLVQCVGRVYVNTSIFSIHLSGTQMFLWVSIRSICKIAFTRKLKDGPMMPDRMV